MYLQMIMENCMTERIKWTLANLLTIKIEHLEKCCKKQAMSNKDRNYSVLYNKANIVNLFIYYLL